MATKKYMIKRMKELKISGDINPWEKEIDFWKRKSTQIKILDSQKRKRRKR